MRRGKLGARNYTLRDMKKDYHGKREWEINGKSFFQGMGREMTGIIEKIISLAIWDPKKLEMPRSDMI